MAKPLKEDNLGKEGFINRVEYVRIIAKALHSLGYEKSCNALEEESGIQLYSPTVNLFRKHVLDGNWDESVRTLRVIENLDESIVKAASFLILECKFFGFLETYKTSDALTTLRTEISPLGINKDRVHELSSYVITGFGNLDFDILKSRSKLLDDLQKLLPPNILIPEGRLEDLVEQALIKQKNACFYHNSLNKGLSLYADHHCGIDQIPSQTIQILQSHQGEVWYLKFSHNGRYLASSSEDKSAIIWEVIEDGLNLKHNLVGHQKPVGMVAWSPDDTELLTCGFEENVRRWDVASGKCICVYEKSGLGIISCGYLQDGQSIFTGVNDRSICLWGSKDKTLKPFREQRSIECPDMIVTKDGKKIISACMNSTIVLFDKETKLEETIDTKETVISFSLSNDDEFLLVNLVNQEIHLYSIKGKPQKLRTFKGHKRTRFVIRSCFGGSEQAFIASGSEDSQVYIWHRASGDLIQTLPGHSGAVNCVAWNPSNPHMLASASDDHTIRIWGLNTNLKSDHANKLKRKEAFANGVISNGNIK